MFGRRADENSGEGCKAWPASSSAGDEASQRFSGETACRILDPGTGRRVNDVPGCYMPPFPERVILYAVHQQLRFKQ